MTEPFLGEIRFGAYNFAPKNWALCNGQSLSVQQNQALFALIGINYGGDGVTTFNLPNLQGRAPLHVGGGINLGGNGGEALHALSVGEMPSHQHAINVDATNAADDNSNNPATGNSLGQSILHTSGGDQTLSIYNSTLSSPTPVGNDMIQMNGGGQGHENRQPYQAIGACICINGLYPSRP